MTNLEPIEIKFVGFCSKKNRKAPRADGRGMFIEPKTRQIIQQMELQVRGDVRDLKLEHPSVEWSFTYTNAHVDKDGIITTVLDILQKYGVILNDNIAHYNGRQVINPAVRGEYDSVTVVLTPAEPEGTVTAPRYINPKRRLHWPATAPVGLPPGVLVVPTDPLEGLRDAPDDEWSD